MLIWDGVEFKQFVGSKWVKDHDIPDAVRTCVNNEPLGGHDTVARQGPVFLKVLHEFLDDPTSSYVDGTASYWRMRLTNAAAGVL